MRFFHSWWKGKNSLRKSAWKKKSSTKKVNFSKTSRIEKVDYQNPSTIDGESELKKISSNDCVFEIFDFSHLFLFFFQFFFQVFFPVKQVFLFCDFGQKVPGKKGPPESGVLQKGTAGERRTPKRDRRRAAYSKKGPPESGVRKKKLEKKKKEDPKILSKKFSISGKLLIPIKYRNCIFYSVS